MAVDVQDDAIATADASAALIDAVREASATKQPLSLRGGGSKGWYGHRVAGTVLDLRGHTGIVDYEPSELVIVARCGTPLAAVEKLLAEHRQMLPFEPPHFAPPVSRPMPTDDDTISRAVGGRGATLGGAVAAGLSGPRRMAAGAVRDFVLGARLVDGHAQHLSFGGRVMKNVAGYDVSRALAGSLGTLGIVTEIALKVLPLPPETATLSFAIDEPGALERLNRWAGQPIAITASAWTSRDSQGAAYESRGGRLMVRLEGSRAAVESGIRSLGGIDVEPQVATSYWSDLREQRDAFFAHRPPDAALWRLALPSIAPPLAAIELGFTDQLVEWGGALRWIATGVDGAVVRDTAARLGGHATLWRASDAQKARHGVFAPLGAPSLAIHRRLKAQFDPAGIFNRGRMYPDL